MKEKIAKIISENSVDMNNPEYGDGLFFDNDTLDIITEELVKLFAIPDVSSNLPIFSGGHISFSFSEEGEVKICEACGGSGNQSWESPVQKMNLSHKQIESCRCRSCGGTGRINYA